MSVQEIEAAITRLPAKDVAELTDYHDRLWEQQIDQDAFSGRLDALLAEVDKEYRAWLARPGMHWPRSIFQAGLAHLNYAYRLLQVTA